MLWKLKMVLTVIWFVFYRLPFLQMFEVWNYTYVDILVNFGVNRQALFGSHPTWLHRETNDCIALLKVLFGTMRKRNLFTLWAPLWTETQVWVRVGLRIDESASDFRSSIVKVKLWPGYLLATFPCEIIKGWLILTCATSNLVQN